MLVQEFCIGIKTVKEKDVKGRNAPKVCGEGWSGSATGAPVVWYRYLIFLFRSKLTIMCLL